MKRSLGLIFIVALFAGALAAQNAANPPVAPVPAEIAAAKKVFISNGGVDLGTYPAAKKLGDVDFGYNSFYDAMKRWGHYDLVGSPADADLVFHIDFAAPIESSGNLVSSYPMFVLTIYDAKTHFALWRTMQPIQGALREQTFRKNFATGLNNLMNDVARLAGQPPAVAPPPPPPAKDTNDSYQP